MTDERLTDEEIAVMSTPAERCSGTFLARLLADCSARQSDIERLTAERDADAKGFWATIKRLTDERDVADELASDHEARADAAEASLAAERRRVEALEKALADAENVAETFECSLEKYESDRAKDYYESGVTDAAWGIAASINRLRAALAVKQEG